MHTVTDLGYRQGALVSTSVSERRAPQDQSAVWGLGGATQSPALITHLCDDGRFPVGEGIENQSLSTQWETP
jgi:hypothetical protein